MPQFRTGTDDFQKLRQADGYFVDKSLFVRDVIVGSDVTLLPRPRRFGKTLNMTMLRYFFEKNDVDRRPLFCGLAISRDADSMAHQGQYPVIYLSLKDIKGNDWPESKRKLGLAIAREFDRHEGLRETLAPRDHEIFLAIQGAQCGDGDLKDS
ncbi:MAG: hypothetical protein ACI8W8_002326, partial [Rhodothermales bacterium]